MEENRVLREQIGNRLEFFYIPVQPHRCRRSGPSLLRIAS